jgi:glycosyltransferase involved in cell wall biosynthesis
MRGKLLTRRNTNGVLAYWKSRPTLPPLYVHFYDQVQDGIQYAGWLRDHNVNMRIGWLERQEYLEIAGKHGMHLCTSEVEAFGHYINEARAMGAMVITTDAAPMNELVDRYSGILVRPSKTVPMNFGFRHLIAPEDLAVAITTATALSLEDRQALGAAARKRFVDEDQKFHGRVHQLFEQLDHLG